MLKLVSVSIKESQPDLAEISQHVCPLFVCNAFFCYTNGLFSTEKNANKCCAPRKGSFIVFLFFLREFRVKSFIASFHFKWELWHTEQKTTPKISFSLSFVLTRFYLTSSIYLFKSTIFFGGFLLAINEADKRNIMNILIFSHVSLRKKKVAYVTAPEKNIFLEKLKSFFFSLSNANFQM